MGPHIIGLSAIVFAGLALAALVTPWRATWTNAAAILARGLMILVVAAILFVVAGEALLSRLDPGDDVALIGTGCAALILATLFTWRLTVRWKPWQ